MGADPRSRVQVHSQVASQQGKPTCESDKSATL